MKKYLDKVVMSKWHFVMLFWIVIFMVSCTKYNGNYTKTTTTTTGGGSSSGSGPDP
ncbi:MAG: hypothetical protein NTZ59_09780 [Bacteroidetes bacterium]|nr:hypothetical protein [Bacteroidota bacterium]